MGFDQAYYTSCEHGLSNRSGYQFNAATPGMPPEVLTDVEALTSYSPPRSLSYSADADEIARSPVNLCYRPGRTTILANVVFVGNDFSHRFGNYFAHALITDDSTRELGSTLPIECWRAPFWVHTPVPDTALPALSLPRSGGGALTRSVVAAFVGNHEYAERIATLVTAVGLAVTAQEQKVVIIERTADATARWIAAVSYLLPGELVLGMSFATYENEPRYSAHTVVGTVPDTAFEANAGAFETNYVFDMVTGQASALAAHPLAELLADIGVESATDAWSRARELATGGEHGLDDWHPVLAATLVGKGLGYAEDAVAVANWLGANASRLGAATVVEIGQRVLPLLQGADNPTEPLAALATAARMVRSDGLADDIELVQVETMLDANTAMLDNNGPIRSARARSAASAALDNRLRLATADDVVALLTWASRAGIDATDDAVRHAGATVLGAEILTRQDDEALLSALRGWPELCAGVVDHLCTIATTRLHDVVGVLCGPVGELLEAQGRPQLREAETIAAVRSGNVPPADALVRVVRDAGGLRPGLLDLLWPGVEWTTDEACHIVLRIDPAIVVQPPLVERLVQVLRAGPPEGPQESTDSFDRLCDAVSESPVFDSLPSAVTRKVRGRRDVLLLVEGLLGSSIRKFHRLLDDLCQMYPEFGRTKQVAVSRKLVEQSDRLSSVEMAFLLARIRHVRDSYLTAVRTAPDRDLAVRMMAQLLGAVGELKRLHAMHKELRGPHLDIEMATIAVLHTWRRKELRRVAELLERGGDQYMAWWIRDRQRVQGGRLAWLMNKWGRRTPPPPLTQPTPRSGR